MSPRYFDRQGRPLTLMEWGERLEDPRQKRVLGDEVGTARVSTVWMGFDHQFGDGPPLIFETMIFDDVVTDRNEWCQRYSTEAEAIAGHRQVVEALRSGATLPD